LWVAHATLPRGEQGVANGKENLREWCGSQTRALALVENTVVLILLEVRGGEALSLCFFGIKSGQYHINMIYKRYSFNVSDGDI